MSTPFSHFSTKINHFTPLEHNFTEVLDAIALKPKTLYIRGKIPKNMSKMADQTPEQNRTERPKVVAVVGSRHNTKYGEEIAYKLAHDLAKKDVIVVSGLAYGIDSIAHRGCLDAGGVTIAVLGTRIDEIYPRNHISLAEEIIEKEGAIISEYAPSSDLDAPLAPGEAGWDGENWTSFFSKSQDDMDKAHNNSDKTLATPFKRRRIDQKYSFLYRNRLIAGLADVVVIVEAAERSGSLNTASHALEQGKYVFAVPGNITNPYSQGCNKLIKQGATPFTDSRDILELLFPDEYIKTRKSLQEHKLIGDTDVETLVLSALSAGLRSGEDIMTTTKLPPEVFNQTVTLLEIKSRIRSLGMNTWALI